ncbi:MAG TPA: type II toxin-antitoxin system VapC family toxin [Candidatus Babeliaceae bacterium]|jgi:predicted nucleic acid-binding protein|nr:type II toxin-antitoxin system VapC family toxin [Candidatus Babeliaceae bacterium]
MKIEAYFADTNAFLYLLEQKPFILPFTATPWHFSVITEVELLGWHKISRKDVSTIRGALSFCVRHPLTDVILEQAISLKQTQKLKTTDALIAATAITLQIPILTADKEFAKIKGLDIILIEL